MMTESKLEAIIAYDHHNNLNHEVLKMQSAEDIEALYNTLMNSLSDVEAEKLLSLTLKGNIEVPGDLTDVLEIQESHTWAGQLVLIIKGGLSFGKDGWHTAYVETAEEVAKVVKGVTKCLCSGCQYVRTNQAYHANKLEDIS